MNRASFASLALLVAVACRAPLLLAGAPLDEDVGQFLPPDAALAPPFDAAGEFVWVEPNGEAGLVDESDGEAGDGRADDAETGDGEAGERDAAPDAG